MGWEIRKYKDRVYGPYFVCRSGSDPEYVGRKPTDKLVMTEYQRQAAREQAKAQRQRLQTLDTQLKDLTKITKTMTKATLLSAGFHQHKRCEWRKRRNAISLHQEGDTSMQNHTLPIESASYDMLEDLVHQAQAGDTTTLPAIRHILDQVPELWDDSKVLAHQVERAWMATICGRDMVGQEVIEREVQALRMQLLGPHPSPLEALLVDRICACWLAVQHAELQATKRLNAHSAALSNAEENRLDKTHRRFLAAVRELARVRKLLRPDAKFQVNLAQNQIVT